MSQVKPAKFPFVSRGADILAIDRVPLMPIELRVGGRIVQVSAIIDSGASVNVLPFSLGSTLGCDWSNALDLGVLSGSLNRQPARGVGVQAVVGTFAPRLLTFAWSKSDDVPLLLGQFNFFAEFDVCFFQRQGFFTVIPSAPA